MELSTYNNIYSRSYKRPTFSSPPIQVDELTIASKKIFVVRDDLLPGGTKQRGVLDLVQEYKDLGYKHFVYASPFCGYAQIALSYACELLNVSCKIFCEIDKSPNCQPNTPHPFTLQAEKHGAVIELTDTLKEAEIKADLAVVRRRDGIKIPLGFSCPSFYRHYQHALKVEWERLVSTVTAHPQRMWLPVGSGTLVRSFSAVLPTEVSICALDVHVLSPIDARIINLTEDKRVTLFSSPQAFHEPSTSCPQFPSNLFYDAKINSFIKAFGRDGDIWWNVAR